MLELLLGNAVVWCIFKRVWIAAEVRMTLNAEPVEGATHVKLLLGVHVKERQVHRRTASVTALLHDITQWEEHILLQLWIEVTLHQRVVGIL